MATTTKSDRRSDSIADRILVTASAAGNTLRAEGAKLPRAPSCRI